MLRSAAVFIAEFSKWQAIIFATGTLVMLFAITWAMTFLSLSPLQFTFMVIFPLIFMVLIPMISLIMWLKTKQR